MRSRLVQLAAAAVLVLLLGACGGTPAGSQGSSSTPTQEGTSATSDELTQFYAGTWRASVETSGNTVYGNIAGKEQMLDLVLEEDGSATLTPLEGHEDLLSGEGTWEAADDTAVTIKLDSGEITLTVVDDANMEGNAADFGIEGFDVLHFEYY